MKRVTDKKRPSRNSQGLLKKDRKERKQDTTEEVIHPIESTEQVLSLMNIYQSEWAHYDEIVWKHAFTHFGFILAFILFPFVTPWVEGAGLALSPIFPWVFPVVGIILALTLGLVMWRYTVRMRCCGGAYRDLIKILPEPYREKQISTRRGPTITIAVAIVMVLLLVGVAVFAMLHIPQWQQHIMEKVQAAQ